MGGTFDPIHFGHLLMAEEARQAFGIDLVVFVPNGQPAHKKEYSVTPPEHRYAMTLLATASNPYFACSRIEIDRPGPSYSIDTIRHFHKLYPGLEHLYFITGADAILQILTWHDYQNLLKECEFIAVTRPGFHLEELPELTGSLFLKHVKFLPIPGLDISSTMIRERVATDHTIKYLTTDTVVNYIAREGLYLRRNGDKRAG
jgi:nicotinate-nucleotide adenylyltransferase